MTAVVAPVETFAHSPSNVHSRTICREVIVITLIALAAGAVRAYHLEDRSLWLDELFSLESSNGRGFAHAKLPLAKFLHDPLPDLTSLRGAAPWWRIWTTQDENGHPPLFFLLLRAWRALVRESPAAGRWLALVFSIAAIPLVYVLARILFHSAAAATWASLLTAFAIPQVQYAREIRHYSMLVAFCLAAAIALERIRQHGWTLGRGVALATTLLAMMLTHYFSAGVIVALALYAIVALRGRDRPKTLACFLAAGVAFAVVWGPWMIQQFRPGVMHNAGQTFEEGAGHLGREIERLLLLPIRYLAMPLRSSRAIAYGMAIIYVLPALLLVNRRARRSDLLLPYLWFICVIVAIFLFDIARHTAHLDWVRFTLTASPALYLLLAGLHPGKWLRHVIPASALAYCLLAFGQSYAPGTENWREVADFIRARAAPGDMTVFLSTIDNWESTPNVLYLGTSYYLPDGAIPQPVLLTDRPISGAVLEKLKSARSIWVVWGFPDRDIRDIGDFIPGAVKQEHWRCDPIGFVLCATFPTRVPATSPVAARGTNDEP